jgi:uncharacterized protein YbaR (Trm112 family)
MKALDTLTRNFRMREVMDACPNPSCKRLSMGLYVERRKDATGGGWWICTACGDAFPVKEAPKRARKREGASREASAG